MINLYYETSIDIHPKNYSGNDGPCRFHSYANFVP